MGVDLVITAFKEVLWRGALAVQVKQEVALFKNSLVSSLNEAADFVRASGERPHDTSWSRRCTRGSHMLYVPLYVPSRLGRRAVEAESKCSFHSS